ncbi:MAG: hypothetical protein WA434_17480, partial [Candidatus Acidiferrales bacterium]
TKREWANLLRRFHMGRGLQVSGKGCQLNRSMQHHPMRSFDHISPGELVRLAVLGQNLAGVVFRPI